MKRITIFFSDMAAFREDIPKKKFCLPVILEKETSMRLNDIETLESYFIKFE